MKKEQIVYIQHILGAITCIEGYVEKKSKAAFLKEKILQDAVIRQIEIIGEASKNISPSVKESHPEIVWRQIAGMKNKLTHQYFGVDLEVVWKTVESEIPKLKVQIQKIEAELQSSK